MVSENSCGETATQVALPSGGPESSPCRAHLASFSIISCPAAERSSPIWIQIWPRTGSEGRSQWADSIALLCIGPRCPRPARRSPFLDKRSGSMGPGRTHCQPAQNCGACQRQTSSLFKKSERTFESSLKIYYAQEIKTNSVPSLPSFSYRTVPRTRLHGLAVRLFEKRDDVIFLRQIKVENYFFP